MNDYYNRLGRDNAREESLKKQEKDIDAKIKQLTELQWNIERDGYLKIISDLQSESQLKDKHHAFQLEVVKKDYEYKEKDLLLESKANQFRLEQAKGLAEYLQKLYHAKFMILEAVHNMEITQLRDRFEVYKEISQKELQLLERAYSLKHEVEMRLFSADEKYNAALFSLKLVEAKNSMGGRLLDNQLSQLKEIAIGIRNAPSVQALEHYYDKLNRLEDVTEWRTGLPEGTPEESIEFADACIQEAKTDIRSARKTLLMILDDKSTRFLS